MNGRTKSMVKASLVVAAACAMGAVGCGKSAEGGSAASSGGSGGCPAGAFKHADPPFCAVLPAGAKPGANPTVFDGYTTFAIEDLASFDGQLKFMQANAKGNVTAKPVESGTLPGGGFFYVNSLEPGGLKQKVGETIVKGPTMVLRCKVTTDIATFDAKFTTCKTAKAL
jgi:hypothetical protein